MNNKKENIEKEELRKIAPTLFGIEKVNNLKAPKGYFSSLADSVEEKIGKEVPIGYFDSLADQVMDKIEKEETKVIPIRRRNYMRIISIAASVAAIFIIGFLLNQENIEEQTSTNEISFENITVEEFEEEFYYTETENLICYVDFEEETTGEQDYEYNDIDLDFTSEEIDEYLSSDYYLDVEF